jgi:hypothetical protein
MKDVLNHLKAYVISHPDILGDPTRWIEGMGWDQNRWPGAQYPHAVCLFIFFILTAPHNS